MGSEAEEMHVFAFRKTLEMMSDAKQVASLKRT